MRRGIADFRQCSVRRVLERPSASPCSWFLGETEAIIDLRSDGNVALAERSDAVRPGNAKRSDVGKILEAAAAHFTELVGLWEGIHGQA
jgi:hypothetical protein